MQRVIVMREVCDVVGDDSTHSGVRSERMRENCSNVSDGVD